MALTPRVKSSLVFALSALSVVVVAALGAALTRPGLGPWYDGLIKPSWTPPPWVFGPVWTTLYALLAVAAWLVAREPWTTAVRRALLLHALQLGLQVAWSGIFFTLRAPTAAALEIVVLVAASLGALVAFARVSRLAGLLLLPYVLWSCFAMALSWAIALG